MGSVSELSSAIAFLRLKNAIALLSSEMLPIPSGPHFDPGWVVCQPGVARHGSPQTVPHGHTCVLLLKCTCRPERKPTQVIRSRYFQWGDVFFGIHLMGIEMFGRCQLVHRVAVPCLECYLRPCLKCYLPMWSRLLRWNGTMCQLSWLVRRTRTTRLGAQQLILPIAFENTLQCRPTKRIFHAVNNGRGDIVPSRGATPRVQTMTCWALTSRKSIFRLLNSKLVNQQGMTRGIMNCTRMRSHRSNVAKCLQPV